MRVPAAMSLPATLSARHRAQTPNHLCAPERLFDGSSPRAEGEELSQPLALAGGGARFWGGFRRWGLPRGTTLQDPVRFSWCAAAPCKLGAFSGVVFLCLNG